MHEVFKIKSSKPTPKILQKPLLILKNPKFCKNPKNLGFKEWNARRWGIKDLPSKEKLD